METNKRIRMYPTIEEWAVLILTEAEEPLNYREITRQIMEKRPIGGKTPQRSVYCVLIRSEKVKLVGQGKFELTKKTD